MIDITTSWEVNEHTVTVLCGQLLESIKSDRNINVEKHFHEPYENVAFISIEGKKITVVDTELFAAVAKLSSNVEYYTKTNGSIRINFTFHGFNDAKLN